ncbi:MAG: hypothetical protein GXO23_06545 [Crenarchaeota archaeon]|nr:hypothetical protein [Thermoproteota archaeon]
MYISLAFILVAVLSLGIFPPILLLLFIIVPLNIALIVVNYDLTKKVDKHIMNNMTIDESMVLELRRVSILNMVLGFTANIICGVLGVLQYSKTDIVVRELSHSDRADTP